jgi:hypothetical protein
LEDWGRCTSEGGCPTFDEVAEETCSERLGDPTLGSCGELTILVLDDRLFWRGEGYDPEGNLVFARLCGDTANYCAGREACHVYGDMPDCELRETNVRLCDEE